MLNMKPKQIIIMALACLLTFNVMAQSESEAWFEQGNAAYNEGNYASAIELYNKVVSADYVSGPLFFNLGNAYYKTKDYAHAILNYEKALKLDPSNDDVRINLEIANLAIADRIEPIPLPFYVKGWNSLKNSFSPDMWAVVTIVLLALFLLSLFVFLVSRRLALRKAGFFTGLVTFVVFAVSFFVALQKRSDMLHLDEAIVTTPTVTVKSSPNATSVDLFVLHEGTKLKVLGESEGWHKVKIANGSVGWLSAESMELF